LLQKTSPALVDFSKVPSALTNDPCVPEHRHCIVSVMIDSVAYLSTIISTILPTAQKKT
jgi:hypothetical protein